MDLTYLQDDLYWTERCMWVCYPVLSVLYKSESYRLTLKWGLTLKEYIMPQGSCMEDPMDCSQRVSSLPTEALLFKVDTGANGRTFLAYEKPEGGY